MINIILTSGRIVEVAIFDSV